MDRVKIFGERNTGTNYFTKLFAENIVAEIVPGVVPAKLLYYYSEFVPNLYFSLKFGRTLGWKHSLVRVDRLTKHRHIENIRFVTITKNPYSFLLSLHKRPYHHRGQTRRSFPEFLVDRWYLQKRDNMDVRHLSSPVELWNRKNGAYLELKEALPSATANLRYEDLLADPEGTLSSVARRFGLGRKGDFRNVLRSTKDDGKSFADYQNYYLDEEWKRKLDSKTVKIINARLDIGVAEAYGYRTLGADEVGDG